jgi:lysophospholipase L1-like esterase
MVLGHIRRGAAVLLTMVWVALPGRAARWPAPTPSGSGAAALAASTTDLSYVALGDSYSAGQGEPPFEPGTDVPGNYCHRSVQAYPVQYAGDQGGGFTWKSYACSGATTDDFFHGGRATDTPNGQIAQVPPSTKMVSLTVGGNDLGFVRIMRACTTHDPEWSNLSQRIDELAPKLHAVYEALHQQAGGAGIFVLGYPMFLSNVDQISFCHDDIGLSAREKDWLNGHLNHLNQVIRAQAEATPGATYVDVQGAFRGHEVCTLEPWSNGWNRDHWTWSYHPNARGHQALAEALAGAAGG